MCPCRLVLDLSAVDSLKIPRVDVLLTSRDSMLYEGCRAAESYGIEEEVMIPRENLFLNVFYGDEGMMGMDGMIIPEGKDCPLVYMHSALVTAEGSEIVRHSVRMCKNHCVMTVYVEGDGSAFPFEMVLKGNVCGYDAFGNILPGNFRCPLEAAGDSVYEIAVPRQKDSSLMLEVNDGTEVLKNFAVGEYIRSCGYDWAEADLKDVTVGIDFARTHILIAVQGWDEVYEFDIVI